MYSFIKKRINIIKICYIILVINLLIYIFFINDNFFGSDYENYFQGAISLEKYFVYSTQGDLSVPDNFRPIGYSLIILFFKILSPNYFNEIIIGVQSILLLVMFSFLIKTLKLLNIFSTKNLIISLVVFLHPIILFTTTQIQCDFFMSFFVSIFIYYFLKFIKIKNDKDLFKAVVFLSLSLYFRPTFMYFIPFLMLVIFKYSTLKKVFFSIIIVILIQSPWIIRNKLILDTYKISMLGDVVLTYFAADTLRHKLNIDPDSAHKIVWERANIEIPYWKNKSNNEIYSRMKTVSFEIIKNDIKYFMYSWLKGVLRVFLMPHEIYSLKPNTSIGVDKFIEKLKSEPSSLMSNFNIYFVYLYIFPYIINFVILYGITKTIVNVKKLFLTYNFVYYYLLPIIIYCLLIPGPINKPHYIMPVYFALIILVVIKKQLK